MLIARAQTNSELCPVYARPVEGTLASVDRIQRCAERVRPTCTRDILRQPSLHRLKSAAALRHGDATNTDQQRAIDAAALGEEALAQTRVPVQAPAEKRAADSHRTASSEATASSTCHHKHNKHTPSHKHMRHEHRFHPSSCTTACSIQNAMKDSATLDSKRYSTHASTCIVQRRRLRSVFGRARVSLATKSAQALARIRVTTPLSNRTLPSRSWQWRSAQQNTNASKCRHALRMPNSSGYRLHAVVHGYGSLARHREEQAERSTLSAPRRIAWFDSSPPPGQCTPSGGIVRRHVRALMRTRGSLARERSSSGEYVPLQRPTADDPTLFHEKSAQGTFCEAPPAVARLSREAVDTSRQNLQSVR